MEFPEVLLRGEDSVLVHISVWKSDEVTGVLAATLDYAEKVFLFLLYLFIFLKKSGQRPGKSLGSLQVQRHLNPGHSFSWLINMRK